DRVDEAIAALTANQTSLAQSQASMSAKIDEILGRLASLDTSGCVQSTTTLPSSSDFSRNHRMKLDVPRFDGSDALGWIFKASQFFDYHATPESDRLIIASFYMEGPVLGWYQWMAS
ncbi:hypothetical protein A2U01_0063074, partial [Trifolium medium]|nr:hypothetical protein [Trifolium medium]